MTHKLRLICSAVSGWLWLTATTLGLGCQGPSIVILDLGGPSVDLNGAAQEAYFRLGHFLVGLSAFDICIKGPGETEFRGPLLRQQTLRPGGVSYAHVSTYLTVAPTSYSVLAVPGAATDCKNALAGLPPLPLPALTQGHHYTFVASGIPGSATFSTLKFNLIEDDLNTQPGQARLRFINAASELQSAELGFGAGTQYAAKLTGAAYGNVGQAGTQVYLTTAALTQATVAVRQSGASSDSLALMNTVNVAAGTAATALITGSSDNKYLTPLSLVVCNDSAPAESGFASCIELP